MIRRGRRRTRAVAAAVAVAIAFGGVVWFAEARRSNRSGERIRGVAPCDVPVEFLQRVRRGYFPRRSGDVLTIEWEPNQFAGVRHSTPFPYTQDVPLLFYGPGFIKAGVVSRRAVTLADIAPTLAELLRFDGFPRRDGRVLREALVPVADGTPPPRLIVTLVWDGGGDNLLRQWPNAWPRLDRLRARGTFFENATGGSSPSITPPMHSTIGTGAFPSRHGQTDMLLRIGDDMEFVWPRTSPRYLEQKTLADLWDVANHNAPVVGAMARSPYHLGMLGHGRSLPGGDRDIAVIDESSGLDFKTNESAYRLPPYLGSAAELRTAIDEVDRRDGSRDRKWLGNAISARGSIDVRATPAWPRYQTTQLVELLDKEGFGRDRIPDLLFANYKSTDLAGHVWNLVEPEEREVLAEQDRQLGPLLRALDEAVGRGEYVVVLTADHGITPYPSETGGYPISGEEVVLDLERRFDHVNPETSIVTMNRGYQIFLNDEELAANDVTPKDVSAFLRAYRVGQNLRPGEPPPENFERRREERAFLTALTPGELDSALACARAHER